MSHGSPAPVGAADEVVALGERTKVAGFALAGVRTCAADDDATVRAAWRDLPATVAVVVLTEAAARALGDDRLTGGAPLTVVLPP